MESTDRITGTVKWFNPTLGYGFILPDEPTREDQEVFVHFNAIQMEGYRKLRKSERVRFTLINNDGNDQAQDVERITENDEEPTSVLAADSAASAQTDAGDPA